MRKSVCRNCGEPIEENDYGNDEYLETLVADGGARDLRQRLVAIWEHVDSENGGPEMGCDRMMTQAEPVLALALTYPERNG